jgi:hypothetical protein
MLPLQIAKLVFVFLPRIFDFTIQSDLHFRLLKQHFFPQLVKLLLIFDSHGITDPTYLVLGLQQILLHIVSVSV